MGGGIYGIYGIYVQWSAASHMVLRLHRKCWQPQEDDRDIEGETQGDMTQPREME